MFALLPGLRIADVIDVLIIAVVLYAAIRWMNQSANRSVRYGLFLLALLYVAAHVWSLYMTLWLFRVGLSIIVIALIIIFQQDLRRGFEMLTTWKWLRGRPPLSGDTVFDAAVEAVDTMAEQRIGALLVFPGREPLDRHLRGGIPLDGEVSLPLLHSIFHPKSPGHDGAVLVVGDRIERFGVHLPMSHNLAAVGEGGTRHTAALGLAECCDALVIVVSEERGTITVAEHGELQIVQPGGELRQRLDEFQQHRFDPDDAVPWHTRITSHPALKAVSLALACGLWMVFAYRVETIERVVDVPVEYRNTPGNWTLDGNQPSHVRVTLSGAERAFEAFNPDSLVLSIDLSEVSPESPTLAITEDHLNLPDNISLQNTEPGTIHLGISTTVELELPIRVASIETLPDGRRVQSIDLEQQVARVLISPKLKTRPREIIARPIDLDQLGTGDVHDVQFQLVPPAGSRFAPWQPLHVDGTITLTPAPSPPEPDTAATAAPGQTSQPTP